MTSKAIAVALLGSAVFAPAASAQPAAYEPPLIQTIDDRPADRLHRVDPLTLALRPRPIRTFRLAGDVTFSPDRRLMAHASGRRARIHVIDVARWRSLGIAGLGPRGPLTLAWPRQDRIVAVSGYARPRILVVDVPSRDVVARHRFGGRWLSGVEFPGGYALLVARRSGIGPTRLLLAHADGGLRTIELERVEGGYDAGGRTARFLRPDITVDPDTGRLYAVAANRPLVAAVDLVAGVVTYHDLGRASAEAAKGNQDGRWRDVAWLGDGRIVVTGERHRSARPPRVPPSPVPFGVRLIDTRDWSLRILDPRPNLMDIAGETLLANGTRWSAGFRRSYSSGLMAFDSTGRRRFTRFRGKDVAMLGSRARVAYVWVRPDRTLHALDLTSGRTIATKRARPSRIPFFLTPRD